MTEHGPGDVVGLIGHKVQIHVSDEPDDPNSYRTISTGGSQDGFTVTAEAGKTFFRYEGEVFMFDGFTQRPNSEYAGHDDAGDADVDLTYPDGFFPDEGHPLKDLTLDEFATLVELGELEPAENPDTTHD